MHSRGLMSSAPVLRGRPRVPTIRRAAVPRDGLQVLAGWATPTERHRVEFVVVGTATHGSRVLPVRGTSTVKVEPLPDASRIRRSIRTHLNKESYLPTWSGVTLLEQDARGNVSTLLTHGARTGSRAASMLAYDPVLPGWRGGGNRAPDLRAFRTSLTSANSEDTIECVDWRRHLGREAIDAVGCRWTVDRHLFMCSQTMGGNLLMQVEGTVWAHPVQGILRLRFAACRADATTPSGWNLELNAIRIDT